jgi:hypothetical protein
VTIQNPARNISLEFFHFILNPEQRRVFQLVVYNYAFRLQIVFTGFLLFSVYITITSLKNSNQFIFVMARCVFFEVRTELLNIIYVC